MDTALTDVFELEQSLLEITGVSLYADQELLPIFMHVTSLEFSVPVLALARSNQRHALPAQTRTNAESPGWQTDSQTQLRAAYGTGKLPG